MHSTATCRIYAESIATVAKLMEVREQTYNKTLPMLPASKLIPNEMH